jgi:hypothetical protein
MILIFNITPPATGTLNFFCFCFLIGAIYKSLIIQETWLLEWKIRPWNILHIKRQCKKCCFMFTSREGFDPATPLFFFSKTVLVGFGRAHNTVRSNLFNIFPNQVTFVVRKQLRVPKILLLDWSCFSVRPYPTRAKSLNRFSGNIYAAILEFWLGANRSNVHFT